MVTIVDLLTKRVHCTHTTAKDLTAETRAKLVIRDHVRLHGTPESIVSHRCHQFVAALFRTLAKSVGINLAYTTAHHHQVDGQTARANQVSGT